MSDLRPRLFGEVISAGVTMIGRVWRRLLPPTFGSFIPLGVATFAVFQATGATEFMSVLLKEPLLLETMDPEEQFELMVPFLEALTITVALQLVATLFVSLATYRLVATEVAERPTGAAEASSYALRRLPAMIAASVLVGLGVVAGSLLLVFPGIWLAGSWTMTAPVLAVERLGPMASIRRSYRLVKGRWWPTVGFLILVGLLAGVAGQLTQFVALPMLATGDVSTGLALSFVLGLVLQGLLVAGVAVMTVMWYLDLRVRKETVLSESLA